MPIKWVAIHDATLYLIPPYLKMKSTIGTNSLVPTRGPYKGIYRYRRLKNATGSNKRRHGGNLCKSNWIFAFDTTLNREPRERANYRPTPLFGRRLISQHPRPEITK